MYLILVQGLVENHFCGCPEVLTDCLRLRLITLTPTFIILAITVTSSKNYKQFLDEVTVISRIIKIEVRVISRSRRLRLITFTETLIILDITKTSPNNCL